MRKKIEEELAKLAFGDLPAEEAARLELRTQGDPEAADAFNTYRRMKDELRMLSVDVPDDQLSKERFREAILTRGLKHEPAATRANWLWMPVAAAVVAFGAFYAKGNLQGPNPASTVVFDQPAVESTDWLEEFSVNRPTPRAFNFTPEPEREPVVSDKPAMRVAMDSSRLSRGTSSPKVASDANASGDEFGEAVVFPGEGKSSAMAKTFDFGEGVGESSDNASMAMPAAAESSSPTTIIVIQSETDATTGARRATEVGDTANVLVGG
jgi:hypothetical protein